MVTRTLLLSILADRFCGGRVIIGGSEQEVVNKRTTIGKVTDIFIWCYLLVIDARGFAWVERAYDLRSRRR